MTSVRIFGRQPAAWVGLIEAALTLLVVTGLVDFTAEQTALAMAAVVAVFGVLTAYLTHDTMLGYVVGLAKAVLALIVGFGVTLSPELTAGIIGFITVGFGFLNMAATSPALVPSLKPAPLIDGAYVVVADGGGADV